MKNLIILSQVTDSTLKIAEYGTIIVLAVAMYALVVKVVAPVVTSKYVGAPDADKGTNTEKTFSRIDSIGERIERTITQRLKATEKRNDRIEMELHEIRNGLSETSIALSAAAATLAFLKERMEKK